IEEVVHCLEILERADHVALQIIRPQFQQIQTLSLLTEGVGLVAVTMAKEVSDHVPDVEISRAPAVGTRSGRVMMKPNRGDKVVREIPARQKPPANFGMVDP